MVSILDHWKGLAERHNDCMRDSEPVAALSVRQVVVPWTVSFALTASSVVESSTRRDRDLHTPGMDRI